MRTALLITAILVTHACQVSAADWLYLTVPGDTLSGIGQTYLRNPKDWPKVQSANGVPIPKHLPANSRLKIPIELLKVTPAPVTVVAVSGNSRFKRADGPYQALKAGETLTGGETVLTGLGASVSYRFADDTRLTQQASSKLNFGRLASYGKTGMVSTELSLDSGRLEASASKQLAPAGGFQVHTPVAVAGLRGTGFRLNVAEDGKTMRNEVVEGAVAVSAQGEKVKVAAGFGTYAEQGKPPAPPVSLLPRPDLSGLPDTITRLPLGLHWPASISARAWRAQLSAEPDFQTVLQDNVFDQPVAQWDAELPDGVYYLRLRGIDQYGLEGFDAQHRFTLDARPLPPMPLKPALGERLLADEVELAWSAADGAQGYLLQLAPTPEFSTGLIERRLPPGDSTRETLPAGDWHWRIASLDKQGRTRAFSPHRAFGIFPPPAPPVLITPALPLSSASPDMTLNWLPSERALAYRVQVAATPDFVQPVVDKRVEATQLSVSLPSQGEWHWRVAALGMGDNTQGFSQNAAWRYLAASQQPSILQAIEESGLLVVTWSGSSPAYRLELSGNKAFSSLLSSQTVTSPQARLIKPAPGTYWLRVIAIDAARQESPPSASVEVVVQHYKPWWLLPLLLLAP